MIKYPCDFENCQNDGTKICSICKTVHYCSAECQKKDWKEHRILCNDATGILQPRKIIENLFQDHNDLIMETFQSRNGRKGGLFTDVSDGDTPKDHHLMWWDFPVMILKEFVSAEQIKTMIDMFLKGYSIYGISHNRKMIDLIYFKK